MRPADRDRRYQQVRHCLTEADQAFARAGSAETDTERIRLIDEAEAWLSRAERTLARLMDRPPAVSHPNLLTGEHRSFGGEAHGRQAGEIWQRTPKA